MTGKTFIVLEDHVDHNGGPYNVMNLFPKSDKIPSEVVNETVYRTLQQHLPSRTLYAVLSSESRETCTRVTTIYTAASAPVLARFICTIS